MFYEPASELTSQATNPTENSSVYPALRFEQGCQICFGTTNQNGEKYTKTGEIYQMAINFNKWTYNIPTKSSIARPSKIYPN
jgi:hypothetical protein